MADTTNITAGLASEPQGSSLFAPAPGYIPLDLSGASNAESEGVGGLPRPYYQHGGITIYHADCRVIMPHLQPFDLLLADPPYGIGESSKRQRTRGLKPNAKWQAPVMKDYGHFDWDSAPVDEWAMCLARQLCDRQIIWGGNYYDLPPTKCLLIWDKENDGKDQADCEIAWTNLAGATRRKRHLWDGFRQRVPEERYHPTQKPLAVISWALQLAGDVSTVIDPWMGSGTTLRACKDHGKQCVGIDAEEKWCEVAAKRLSQEALPLGGGGGFLPLNPSDEEPREGYNGKLTDTAP